MFRSVLIIILALSMGLLPFDLQAHALCHELFEKPSESFWWAKLRLSPREYPNYLKNVKKLIEQSKKEDLKNPYDGYDILDLMERFFPLFRLKKQLGAYSKSQANVIEYSHLNSLRLNATLMHLEGTREDLIVRLRETTGFEFVSLHSLTKKALKVKHSGFYLASNRYDQAVATSRQLTQSLEEAHTLLRQFQAANNIPARLGQDSSGSFYIVIELRDIGLTP